jgi:hypothetical protein
MACILSLASLKSGGLGQGWILPVINYELTVCLEALRIWGIQSVLV